MTTYSLIELVMLLAAFYVVLSVEGTLRLWVSLPCLVAVLLLERIQHRRNEDKKAAERLEKFSSAELRKKMQAQLPDQ